MRGNVKSLVHIIVDNIRQETFTEMPGEHLKNKVMLKIKPIARIL